MKITVKQLRNLVNEAITKTTYIPTAEDIAAMRSDLKGSAKPDEWRGKTDQQFQQTVEELSELPEYESVETFVQYKIDDEDETFSTVDLNAIAMHQAEGNIPSEKLVKTIKAELIGYGLKFVPRQPTKFVRGVLSPKNGTNRFADMPGGGSGVGRDAGFGGTSTGFFSYGYGPGAVGGKYDWQSGDKRNLPMGAGRVKK